MSRPPPTDFASSFATAFCSGNLQTVLDLYMPGGVLIDQSGAEHRGREAIAAIFRPLLANRASMSIVPQTCIEYADIAVLRNEFQIMLHDHALIKSKSFEVLRLDGGMWKLAIDYPFG